MDLTELMGRLSELIQSMAKAFRAPSGSEYWKNNHYYNDYYPWSPSYSSIYWTFCNGFPGVFSLPSSLRWLPAIYSSPLSPYLLIVSPSPPLPYPHPQPHNSGSFSAICHFLWGLWVFSKFLGQACFCSFSSSQLFFCESYCPLCINLEPLSAACLPSCVPLTGVVFHLTACHA